MIILKWLAKWVILSGSILVAAYVVPGISVPTIKILLLVGLVLGLINVFIKPVLKILTLPVNILTLGIFGLVLNALLFWFAAYLVNGFSIANLWAALLGSVIVAVISWVMYKIID